jgi:dihydroflavonol-4-reductase
LAAESRGTKGEHYILKGEYAEFSRVADYVFQATGARPPRINVSKSVARAAAPLIVSLSRLTGQRPLITPESIQIISRHQKIETDKAEKELGLRPRPLKTTISDTVAWFQQHRITTTTNQSKHQI